jgi:D-serine dehydratase
MPLHHDLLDPVLDASWKGYPHTATPRRRSEIGAACWNVLAGDLPLPLAVLRRAPLEHNLHWLQQRAQGWGVRLAPHGKTTMSPQLFGLQLDAGAWGMSFATVTQAGIGAAAGARNILIANQVVGAQDLAGIQALLAAHAGQRIAFLVDSHAQLARIADWHAAHAGSVPFEVLVEIGVDGARTGCRDHAGAVALAQAVHASPATRLVGVECYEGQGATGDSAADAAYVETLMQRVHAVLGCCIEKDLFDSEQILVTAGGSALYDLVATRLNPALDRPVQALLRSGCYLTHDHGNYQRLQRAVDARLGCAEGESLQGAMEVWALVQSCPEPGLALLTAGRRDVSYDQTLPVPIAHAPHGSLQAQSAPAGWQITALNDQHAYLRWDPADASAVAPAVGDRVALGISHPCTTFDKWRWMAVVEADYRVSDAIVTHF